MKISWNGPLVNRIDWCSSTYMVVRLSETRAAFLGCFCPYVRQPHDHIGWATSMPFASINFTNPRTNPWNFHKKNIENWRFWKRYSLDRFEQVERSKMKLHNPKSLVLPMPTTTAAATLSSSLSPPKRGVLTKKGNCYFVGQIKCSFWGSVIWVILAWE